MPAAASYESPKCRVRWTYEMTIPNPSGHSKKRWRLETRGRRPEVLEILTLRPPASGLSPPACCWPNQWNVRAHVSAPVDATDARAFCANAIHDAIRKSLPMAEVVWDTDRQTTDRFAAGCRRFRLPTTIVTMSLTFRTDRIACLRLKQFQYNSVHGEEKEISISIRRSIVIRRAG